MLPESVVSGSGFTASMARGTASGDREKLLLEATAAVPRHSATTAHPTTRRIRRARTVLTSSTSTLLLAFGPCPASTESYIAPAACSSVINQSWGAQERDPLNHGDESIHGIGFISPMCMITRAKSPQNVTVTHQNCRSPGIPQVQEGPVDLFWPRRRSVGAMASRSRGTCACVLFPFPARRNVAQQNLRMCAPCPRETFVRTARLPCRVMVLQ